MLEQKELVHILRRELPLLVKKYGVRNLGIFGSFAKGCEREDSDVDILVEFEKPLGLSFLDFSEHIEKLCGRKTDIMTSEGLRSVRLKKVAEDIKRSVIYV
jgi:predicted nucleotidyltransferase